MRAIPQTNFHQIRDAAKIEQLETILSYPEIEKAKLFLDSDEEVSDFLYEKNSSIEKQSKKLSELEESIKQLTGSLSKVELLFSEIRGNASLFLKVSTNFEKCPFCGEQVSPDKLRAHLASETKIDSKGLDKQLGLYKAELETLRSKLKLDIEELELLNRAIEIAEEVHDGTIVDFSMTDLKSLFAQLPERVAQEKKKLEASKTAIKRLKDEGLSSSELKKLLLDSSNFLPDDAFDDALPESVKQAIVEREEQRLALDKTLVELDSKSKAAFKNLEKLFLEYEISSATPEDLLKEIKSRGTAVSSLSKDLTKIAPHIEIDERANLSELKKKINEVARLVEGYIDQSDGCKPILS